MRVADPSRRTDLEAELVVVRRTARNVAVQRALEYIAGYACGNDVSECTAQHEDWPGRSKGFDTFAPIEPYVETKLSTGTRIRATRNGEVVRDAMISDLIFDVPTLAGFVSAVTTLESGDLILSGTAAGVTPIHPGYEVAVTIEGIGTLTNPVATRATTEP